MRNEAGAYCTQTRDRHVEVQPRSTLPGGVRTARLVTNSKFVEAAGTMQGSGRSMQFLNIVLTNFQNNLNILFLLYNHAYCDGPILWQNVSSESLPSLQSRRQCLQYNFSP